MRRAIHLLILCSLAALGMQALAQPSPELQKRLRQLQGKPLASWTQADLDELRETMLTLTREMLASEMNPERRARFERLVIRGVDWDYAPPAWTDGRTIDLSEDALGTLLMLGMYLGHDLYVLHGDHFAVPPSLLVGPYGTRPLLPLLPGLQYVMVARGVDQLIRCPSTEQLCAGPQYSAVLATMAFVVAHEFGHVLLGHQQKAVHPVAEEVAADREAWRMVLAVAPQKPRDEDEDDLDARARTAFVAAPFLVLRWLRDSTVAEGEIGAIDERADKLRDLAGDEYFGDPSSLVEPEPVVGRLRTVTIAWTEEPEEIWIEGTRVAAGEVAGRRLSLMTPARIVARKGGRFGFAEIGRDAAGVATLELLDPLSAAPSAQELDAMRRERKWFRLFLATTSPAARPRSPEVAVAFNRALNGLGLGSWIDPTRSPSARRSWIEAQPLGTWRAP